MSPLDIVGAVGPHPGEHSEEVALSFRAKSPQITVLEIRTEVSV